jgi:hypothetical protein
LHFHVPVRRNTSVATAGVFSLQVRLIADDDSARLANNRISGKFLEEVSELVLAIEVALDWDRLAWLQVHAQQHPHTPRLQFVYATGSLGDTRLTIGCVQQLHGQCIAPLQLTGRVEPHRSEGFHGAFPLPAESPRGSWRLLEWRR